MTTGDVELTILDGGAGVVVVPASSVAVVIGACSGGVEAQVVATRNANSLSSVAGVGPAIDQAAMIIAAGGTVLFMKSATTTAGALNKKANAAITAVSAGGVITATAHGYATGDVITITGVVGAIEVNTTGKITVITANTFSIDGVSSATTYVSGGTATAEGTQMLAAGTSIVTITGAPYDAYLGKIVFTSGGTRGTAGIRFKLSLDAGRTYGPEIALGTASTYAITGTGITIAFGAGTILAGETVTFGCVEPLTSVASVQACLVALEASPYAVTGWGSMRIVGPRSGADAASIQGYLDTMVATKTFPRAILELRDNALPSAYGGAGENDPTWTAALGLDVSALSAKRVCAVAGNYNMNSMFPIPAAGTPRMRRNLAYALACRQAAIKPQTHAGRVSDGSLAQIIVDPTNDPKDGFNYHDDYNAGFSLKTSRITGARKRKGKPGYFITDPLLMSPPGSVFTLLPLGNVMDIGCSLVYQTGDENINSDVQLNPNGTIDEKAAQAIEIVVRRVLKTQMFDKSMISGFSYTIDRTNNVQATSEVNFACTLFARGYILQLNGTIGYGQAA